MEERIKNSIGKKYGERGKDIKYIRVIANEKKFKFANKQEI